MTVVPFIEYLAEVDLLVLTFPKASACGLHKGDIVEWGGLQFVVEIRSHAECSDVLVVFCSRI